jgi:hypothetical protein
MLSSSPSGPALSVGSVPIRQLDAGPEFDEGAHEDDKGTAEKEVAFPAACPIALSRQHGPQQKSLYSKQNYPEGGGGSVVAPVVWVSDLRLLPAVSSQKCALVPQKSPGVVLLHRRAVVSREIKLAPT